MNTAERFWSKVYFTGIDTCWLWTAGLTEHGYGRFRDGRNVLAHRWSYEACISPIPDGLQLDHLCRAHNCVNPYHVEAVTGGENVRRGLHGVLRTHCPHGHELTPENTFDARDQKRRCKPCNRRSARIGMRKIRKTVKERSLCQV